MTEKEPTDLAEVWGETVSLRNLALSLAISVPTTVIVYYIGHAVLVRAVSDPDRAETFSLLCGLASVIICAVLCARLFAPQRVLVDDPVADSSSVEDALRELRGRRRARKRGGPSSGSCPGDEGPGTV